MSRKRKELPLLSGVEITGVAAEGKSIARVEDMVVFIPYGAPGDIADVKLDKKKRSYAEGHIERLVTPSPMRITPRCRHFGTCGGCKWQHLPYDAQLRFKQQQVEDALIRIAKVKLPSISTIIGSDDIWCYRNKMEYTFSNKKWLTYDQIKSGDIPAVMDAAGFHIPGAFDKVLDIEECHLQDPLGDQLRLFIRDYGIAHGLDFYDLRANEGLLRTLMIRIASTGETMALMAFGRDDTEAITRLLDAVRAEFPRLTSLLYVINTKANDTFNDLEVHIHSGREYIEEEMEGLRFRIGPKSFYQTNSHQAHKLYSVARDFAALTGRELVYDLYTGTGTIAQFVARNARHVIGIEYVPEAIEDAKLNARVNGLNNTDFLAGDMKDVLTDDFIEANGRPDVMIVDPPRAGMHQDVVDVILRAEPATIVYVSCNPATQARDLALLDAKYQVEAVQPVDMFPHTHHVENVVKLTLRRNTL
ncbi:MAG: 23S rRNA (uracil(1939)-C(5))-methyltransferase RlmD [Candidatus Amulumruptor caecigallinarius]|nr:23S rRNA (uracil(1939)-C(5))-methyltransferase RlmD [Candidatus Amulumruptor caecigallinarius]MCM1397311.1 23S rRNA (uracil(1939)-C(5))-methyltransferase RlmD [Candidatus Amulumruptor caecigallinarius]MCM1453624.1 23S rRNA (uracil(1939)-C(5))-methyltransferase RlmD [bacterium]